jgi:hypothetical protein
VIPIRIQTESKLFRYYSGFSFFIFIFIWKEAREKEILINHELIHFYQQVEMLFVFHWLLYLLFYLIARVKGKDHDTAYYSIPFEKEAYTFEHDLHYIRRRKLFAWVKFL